MAPCLLVLLCFLMGYCHALKMRKDLINPLNSRKYDMLFRNNNDFDVVIVYTTDDNCVECDYLETQYRRVKDEFLSIANLYFARLDIMKISKNSDSKFMDVNGIPAVIFYPKGASPKKGMVYKYNGDKYRQQLRFDTLSDWVRSHYKENKQEI